MGTDSVLWSGNSAYLAIWSPNMNSKRVKIIQIEEEKEFNFQHEGNL